MLKLTVAKWANDFMISWAHTKEMVANASGRVESFTPVVVHTFYINRYFYRVPTVLEKSWNFGFPWKVLENEFVLEKSLNLGFFLEISSGRPWFLVLCSLNGYSKLRGTRANFSLKNLARFARSSLQVEYFSSSFCSYLILEQLLSFPSFPKNTYRYLCILCVSMYQSGSKWAISLIVT